MREGRYNVRSHTVNRQNVAHHTFVVRQTRAMVTMAAMLTTLSLLAGCKGAGSTSADGHADGLGDGTNDLPLPMCPEPEAASDMAAADDFGPNAKAVAMPSAMGRVNVYEVTAPHLLERVDIYVRANLAGSRVTISVFEAPAKDKDFQKLADVQVDVPPCEGWASSGTLAVPFARGRFYAIGFDPNQLITTFVNADMSNIPVDGRFGRLIGSKTVTTVSTSTLGWDKVADKDFMRQRLLTSPRADDDAGVDDDAGTDAGADTVTADAGDGASGDVSDGGVKDAADAIGS
jgi:hypothetical protein